MQGQNPSLTNEQNDHRDHFVECWQDETPPVSTEKTTVETEHKSEAEKKDPECSACHTTQIKLPYTLDCGHVFCYLCLKARYEINPMCNSCGVVIDPNVYENARGNKKTDVDQAVQWLYSGRVNGWWYYDQNTNQKLEEGYQAYLKALETKGLPLPSDRPSKDSGTDGQITSAKTAASSDSDSDSDLDSDSDDGIPEISIPEEVVSISVLNRTYSINYAKMTQLPLFALGTIRKIMRSGAPDPTLMIKGVAGLQNPKPTSSLLTDTTSK